MTKGPDLSVFPIPRKGGAKPIAMDEAAEAAAADQPREGEGVTVIQPAPAPTLTVIPALPAAATSARKPPSKQPSMVDTAQTSTPMPSGQTVATTVKLDENRYLRLADAGKPGPGRLKRRTIQEMVVEALDEWFERRGL
jgi:hypothetical protein